MTKIVVKYDQELDVNKEYDMANQVVGVDLTDSYYMDFELDIDDNNEIININQNDNISFKINANETVAFVGKSGAGKTTIFSLLCNFFVQ